MNSFNKVPLETITFDSAYKTWDFNFCRFLEDELTDKEKTNLYQRYVKEEWPDCFIYNFCTLLWMKPHRDWFYIEISAFLSSIRKQRVLDCLIENLRFSRAFQESYRNWTYKDIGDKYQSSLINMVLMVRGKI